MTIVGGILSQQDQLAHPKRLQRTDLCQDCIGRPADCRTLDQRNGAEGAWPAAAVGNFEVSAAALDGEARRFFFIRPQMKRSKDQKKFKEGLQKGQKVITIGGIHGRIVEIQETTVTIEVENNVRLRIEKSAVAMDNSQTIEAK